MTNELFTSYLDTNKTAVAASEQLREAIALTVIANTAKEKRVDEAFFEILKEEAKIFSMSSRIVFIVDDIKKTADFCFCGSETQKMQALQYLMAKVTETSCFYGDRDSVTIKNESFTGFCWPYNGTKYFCGYPKPQEAQSEDWDYDCQCK